MTQSSKRPLPRWIMPAGIGLVLIVVMIVIASLASSASPVILSTPTPIGAPSPVSTARATATPTASFKPVTITLTPPLALSDLATQYPSLSNILIDPELNSVYKAFLIAYQQGGSEAAIDLARRRGILTAQDEIRATLILDAPYNAELVRQLESIGVVIESAYKTQIDIAVPVAVIQRAIDSGQPEAVFKRLTGLQHVIRVKLPDQLVPQVRGDDFSHRLDPIIGQGVQVIGADEWQRAGYTGAGVKVGILDCGFKGYKDLLGVELPASVEAKSFVRSLSDTNDSGEKHGTAVAEIIHEIAPDAELVLADYGCRGGPPEGNAIDWLLERGVRIISNSTGNSAAPMDGTGWDAELAQSATDQGVLWINSAGNEAERHYRGQFTDADGNGFHEFKPDQETIGFLSDGAAVEITLRWDDWLKIDQDFDLFLLDADGNTLVASRDSQSGMPGDRPVEKIRYKSLTPGDEYRVAIYAANAERAVTLDLYFEGEVAIELPTADYSIISPADARTVIAVGAVNWSTDRITDYSSRGPTVDGRTKPDIAAPTGVDNFTYRRFGGTSASAPHVAGAAALVLSAFPKFDRQQVWDYLINNALDLGSAGVDNDYGAGRLQLPAPPTAGTPIVPVSTLMFSATPMPATPMGIMLPPWMLLITPMPATPTPATPMAVAPPTPVMIVATPTPVMIVATPTPVMIVATPTPTPPGIVVDNIGWLIGVGGGVLLLLIVIVIILLVRRRRPSTGLPPGPTPQVPPSYPVPSYPPQQPVPHGPAPHVPTSPAAGAQPRPPSMMATCPHCGKPIRSGAKFCAACGKAIAPPAPIVPPQRQAHYCNKCGQPLRPGAKFCARCGTRQ